jgi:CRISPR system Cascade subunit CasE
VRLSTLDFDGLLTVADPGRFGELLFSGLGPAKGFGCGLMLIKGAG